MIRDNDIIGGNAKDNGPLDALLKGEQLSADALIEIRLQEIFALKARECNEHQDFEDRGGSCRGRGREARARHLSAFEASFEGFGKEFNKAVRDANVGNTPLIPAIFAPKSGPIA